MPVAVAVVVGSQWHVHLVAFDDVVAAAAAAAVVVVEDETRLYYLWVVLSMRNQRL